MVDVKIIDKPIDGKEQIKVKLNKDYASVETTIEYIKSLVDPISHRFTKKYELFEDEKTHFS
jgi:hypothetical protein